MLLTGIDTEALRKIMASFDWKEAFHDPLYENAEVCTPQDKLDAAKMQRVIDSLQQLFFSSAEGRQVVHSLLDTYWTGQPMAEQISMLFALNEAGHDGHVLLRDAIIKARDAIKDGCSYALYNERSYFLTAFDIHLFRSEQEAKEVTLQPAHDRFTQYKLARFDSMESLSVALKIDSNGMDLPVKQESKGANQATERSSSRRRKFKRNS